MTKSKNVKRPVILKWLCFGSALTGLSWIIMFLTLIFYSVNGAIPSGLFPGLITDYLHVGYIFIVIEIILTALGLTGVFLMWQMKRNGFYLYAGIKMLNYFLPVMFIGSSHLTYPGLILTSGLIIAYGVVFTNYL